MTGHGTTPGDLEGVAAIAVAIDQLTADVRTHSGRPEHTARVAELWLMVASLDPELARRVERYGTPATVVPSAAAAGTADAGSP